MSRTEARRKEASRSYALAAYTAELISIQYRHLSRCALDGASDADAQRTLAEIEKLLEALNGRRFQTQNLARTEP